MTLKLFNTSDSDTEEDSGIYYNAELNPCMIIT